MKTLVLITYYNRKVCTERLIRKLKKMGVDIVVFDDYSSISLDTNVEVIRNPYNYGKREYWKTWNKMFAYCKEHPHDYYIFLPDDAEIGNSFVEDLIRIYQNTNEAVSLCPLTDDSIYTTKNSRWGGVPIEIIGETIKSNFFDCCGLVTDKFFQCLDYILNPIDESRWNGRPNLSSGVGEQITLRLQRMGENMYHTKYSFVGTGKLESEMNKNERKKHPLHAELGGYKRSVDVYMASIWRGGYIVDTIKSILAQDECNTMTVSLNNYTKEQYEYLINNISDQRLILRRTNNEKGSNEKLRFVANGTSKYVAFVDDDIIYGKDYLLKMISKCNQLGGIVSMHGSRLTRLPLKHYYKDRAVYACSRRVIEDIEVDVIGNGVSLMRRDIFKEEEWDILFGNCSNVSMDDIYISEYAKRHGVKLYVVSHDFGELKLKEIESGDNSVYVKYRNNDSAQTEFINNHYKSIIDPKVNKIETKIEVYRFGKRVK